MLARHARFDRFFAAMLQSKYAELAQLVEQPIRNRQVPSSSLGLGSIFSMVQPGDMGDTTYLRHR